MEEKTTKTPKECFNCRRHTTYYTKCVSSFYREKTGFCSKKNALTKNHDTCESWERRDCVYRKKLHREAAGQILKKMASDISVIAQILSEDAEEEREEQKNR
jgi:hypothetical protein